MNKSSAVFNSSQLDQKTAVPQTAGDSSNNKEAEASSIHDTNSNFFFVNETLSFPAFKNGRRADIRSHVRKYVLKQKGVRKGARKPNQPLYSPLAPQKLVDPDPDPVDDGISHRIVPIVGSRQDGGDDRSKNFTTRGVTSKSGSPKLPPHSELLDDVHQAKVPHCHCLTCKPPATTRGSAYRNMQLVRRSALAISPIEILGASRADPFLTYPNQKLTRFVHEMIDQMVTIMSPGFMLDGSKTSHDTVAKSWLSNGLKHPLLFHALVFGGMVHADFLRTSKINASTAKVLTHKLAALRELKIAMANLEESYTDAFLLAMLIISFCETADPLEEGVNPFMALLQDADWLNAYSSLKAVPEHMVAITALINWRGGIDNIKLPGLAEILVKGDVVSATRSLSKPFFPQLRNPEEWTDHAVEWARCQLPSDASPLGQKFLQLQDYGLDSPTISIIIQAIAVSIAIDYYTRKTPGCPSLAAICKARTMVQRNLLELPPAGPDREPSPSKPDLYEACRLITIIYGVGVIYPVANSYKVLQMLVQRLKAALEVEDFNRCEAGVEEFFLWVLVLGGIAAFGKPERQWFVLRLADLGARAGIRDWVRVERILGSFLWLESACSPGGRQLWEEVLEVWMSSEDEVTLEC